MGPQSLLGLPVNQSQALELYYGVPPDDNSADVVLDVAGEYLLGILQDAVQEG